MRLDRLQVGIAIGAIDNGVELGMQRHLVPADLDLEVRGVGLAIHHDLVQRALVCPLRGEDAANALDGAQVGIVEGVGAAQRGRSRPVGIPGAKVASALDLAHRLGIGQDGGKIQRLAGPDRAQGRGSG